MLLLLLLLLRLLLPSLYYVLPSSPTRYSPFPSLLLLLPLLTSFLLLPLPIFHTIPSFTLPIRPPLLPHSVPSPLRLLPAPSLAFPSPTLSVLLPSSLPACLPLSVPPLPHFFCPLSHTPLNTRFTNINVPQAFVLLKQFLH